MLRSRKIFFFLSFMLSFTVVCATVDPVLSNVRGKAGELYGKVEPTVGPYVDQVAAALGRLAANLRSLAAEGTDRLLRLSKEIPLGSSGSLYDLLFGDAEAQVRYCQRL
jgi:hypothetical protein